MTTFQDPADLLFTQAALFTFPWKTSRPGALAVRGGRIVAVGSEADLAGLRGPATRVVDLGGGLLAPGFQDVHVHPVTAGIVLDSCYLQETSGRDKTLEVIAQYVATHRQSAWIRGWGFKQEDFPPVGPTRQILDAIIPDQPAYLTRSDGHAAVVNSRALELAGITANTPDPEGGRLERDASGSPTGLLHEWAMGLVQAILPPETPAELLAGLRRGQDHLLSLGITSWQDASVGLNEQQAYTSLDAAGELIAHVTGALRWDGQRGLEQIIDLVERRQRFATEHFSPTSVKIMQDGVVEGSLSAAVLEPYLDPATGQPTKGVGASFHQAEELKEIVAAVTARGFQIQFHVIGDRAVREALDALEYAAVRHGALAHPPILSHIQLVHPLDRERFAKVGAIASMQPFWAARDSTQEELTIPFLGPERSAQQYPFRGLVDAGAVLAGGSDWMISSAYPIDAIQVAVNRAHLDPTSPKRKHAQANPEPLYLENAITLAEGLTAYTYGGAYANQRWHQTGRLVPGARADLVLLDRDPFAGPPDQIGTAEVQATYVGGRAVYAA